MKRRYDVPQGKKEWVVTTEQNFNDPKAYKLVSVAGQTYQFSGSAWFLMNPQTRVFTIKHKALTYFTKQHLLAKNDTIVGFEERTVQDFSMWRKK